MYLIIIILLLLLINIYGGSLLEKLRFSHSHLAASLDSFSCRVIELYLFIIVINIKHTNFLLIILIDYYELTNYIYFVY